MKFSGFRQLSAKLQAFHTARPWLTYLAFLAGSVLLNYLPDLSPYYVAALSNGKLRVAGPLSRYAEPCLTEADGDWVCRVEYRLPRSELIGAQAVGLGVILFNTEISCSSRPQEKAILIGPEEEGRIAGNLRTYQTFNLDRLPCDADLLVRNFSTSTFSRYGYSQAPVTIGDASWVDRTKVLVELSIAGLLATALFTFAILYLVLRSLERVTDVSLSTPPFDDFRIYWIGFLVLAGGHVLDLIPVSIPFGLVSKLTSFFGLMSISGPIFQHIAIKPQSFPRLHRIFQAVAAEGKVWRLALICLAFVLPSYFRYSYPYSILAAAILGCLAGVRSRNMAIFLFGVAALLDSFKILMVQALPGSRVTAIYTLFLLARQMRSQILATEENARFEAGTSVALQLAHDIRSPIGVIKNILPRLGGPLEETELASAALVRLSAVASQLLKDAKTETTPSVLEVVEVCEIVRKISLEKRSEVDLQRIQINANIPPTEAFVFANEAILTRILSNILNNAIEALVSKGEITTTVSLREKEVFISVRDNGMGIPTNTLNQITREGFTTKREGSTRASLYSMLSALF